jgi:hypothetical protein
MVADSYFRNTKEKESADKGEIWPLINQLRLLLAIRSILLLLYILPLRGIGVSFPHIRDGLFSKVANMEALDGSPCSCLSKKCGSP